jgi:hypothetical protein
VDDVWVVTYQHSLRRDEAGVKFVQSEAMAAAEAQRLESQGYTISGCAPARSLIAMIQVPRGEALMPLYRVDFVDHGENAYDTRYFGSYHDEGAIIEARRLYVPGIIGAGFEVWQDDRLVHRERNFPRGSDYPADPDRGQASHDGATMTELGNLFLAIELVQGGMTDLPLIARTCDLPLDTIEEIAAAHAVNNAKGSDS